MHMWGDEDFDWDSLHDAVNYLQYNLTKWGRIGAHCKEKYGSARAYIYWWDGTLHSLVYPGFVFYQWPRWTSKINQFFSLNILTRAFHKYQYWVYKKVYINAVKKWPHIKEEIICCMDYPELLK